MRATRQTVDLRCQFRYLIQKLIVLHPASAHRLVLYPVLTPSVNKSAQIAHERLQLYDCHNQPAIFPRIASGERCLHVAKRGEKAELAVLVESTYRLICRMSRAGICGVHLAARSSRRALPSRFYHHPPAARKNFWEKCETDATFWAFRGSIYIRGCDRDVWPFRCVRRAAPAALGGEPLQRACAPFGGRARPQQKDVAPMIARK